MYKRSIYYAAFILSIFLFAGWGKTGHSIINDRAVSFFPEEMSSFASWKSYLSSHASDADYRKSDDPSESNKHYIDIDAYPEFVSAGKISENLDSLIAMHSQAFIDDQGILPWAIIASVDSLTNQFQRKDWDKAKQTAADLGHYVADSHNPLHITKNYNGQLSGQYGVHSRYESTMVDKYKTLFSYSSDSVGFVSNVSAYVFGFIYSNYVYVDSVLIYDKTATTNAGGSTSSDAYYQKLWELTGNFTNGLFKDASHRLAALIYTAWLNAGKPDPNTTPVTDPETIKHSFMLEQNYPNPFNPSTTIKFSVPSIETRRGVSLHTTIILYDLLGREITTLVNELKSPGNYQVNFNAADLPSGIYFYRFSAGSFNTTRKMLLLK